MGVEVDSNGSYNGSPSIIAPLEVLFSLTNIILFALICFIAYFPITWFGELADNKIVVAFNHYRTMGPWVLVLLGLLASALELVKNMFTSYSLANGRIEFSRGVFSRKHEFIDLFNLGDVTMYQTLIGRLAGVGTITLYHHGGNEEMFEFHRIRKAKAVYDLVKQLGLEADARRRSGY